MTLARTRLLPLVHQKVVARKHWPAPLLGSAVTRISPLLGPAALVVWQRGSVAGRSPRKRILKSAPPLVNHSLAADRAWRRMEAHGWMKFWVNWLGQATAGTTG